MSFKTVFSTIIIAFILFIFLAIMSMQKATIDGLLDKNESLEVQLAERGE